MECSTKTLTFKVSRKTPELITPSQPTPHEFKPLSAFDNQELLRVHPPYIAVYEGSPFMQGKDPVNIIRHAIAKALVFYYPLAGRLREITTRNLMVECTAEGVLFIEADADTTVEQLADLLHPPFPNMDQLLYNVPGFDGIIDSPLILFQVTRLKCGGFIFGFRFTHIIADGVGIMQFMIAVGELARGGEAPMIRPVWERHLLSSRNPPCVSCAHPAYEPVPESYGRTLIQFDNIVERSFFLSAADIAALRGSMPPHFRSCSQFDLLSAFVWHCRTVGLSQNPNEKFRLMFPVSIHNTLPRGYYGNAVVLTVAIATADELCKNPLHYIIEVLRKAKSKVTEEYVKSFMDLLVTRGEACVEVDQTFVVSYLGRVRLDGPEFGWGKAAYAGMADGGSKLMPGVLSWFIPAKNNKGEEGMIVPIALPPHAMEIFRKELKMMMEIARKTTIYNASAL